MKANTDSIMFIIYNTCFLGTRKIALLSVHHRECMAVNSFFFNFLLTLWYMITRIACGTKSKKKSVHTKLELCSPKFIFFASRSRFTTYNYTQERIWRRRRKRKKAKLANCERMCLWKSVNMHLIEFAIHCYCCTFGRFHFFFQLSNVKW